MLSCPPPGDFLTQGLNPHLQWLLHCRQILSPLSHRRSRWSKLKSNNMSMFPCLWVAARKSLNNKQCCILRTWLQKFLKCISKAQIIPGMLSLWKNANLSYHCWLMAIFYILCSFFLLFLLLQQLINFKGSLLLSLASSFYVFYFIQV